MEAKKISTFVFIAFFIMLGGCSTSITTPDSIPKPPSISTSNKPSTIKVSPIPPELTTPCVYESIKGVAEVIDINNNEVTYKFYPGDLIFSLPASSLSNKDISPTQELKAIIRKPLSGPCGKIEFELLSTVE
jgi:hypothetical protein